jgi:hypothetical protein
MHRPIKVAILQCGIVGVISTRTEDIDDDGSSLTVMWGSCTTASCDSVKGCSGSDIVLTKSKVSHMYSS